MTGGWFMTLLYPQYIGAYGIEGFGWFLGSSKNGRKTCFQTLCVNLDGNDGKVGIQRSNTERYDEQ